ncbi:hypothetical protein EJ03DRAFT_65352 [Teratosphaeria nubilosa]|uniref:Uncharacterized protein n=1 Tax=Teratosphaeria nubilosa TaxID=161662 RepID=A0A6G1LDB5_9PEZI|nr:hypothetical protein EJ03DRAFT_65352 [Teratosphaeria nubilosa]
MDPDWMYRIIHMIQSIPFPRPENNATAEQHRPPIGVVCRKGSQHYLRKQPEGVVLYISHTMLVQHKWSARLPFANEGYSLNRNDAPFTTYQSDPPLYDSSSSWRLLLHPMRRLPAFSQPARSSYPTHRGDRGCHEFVVLERQGPLARPSR